MDFKTNLKNGLAFEQKIIDRLQADGWIAESYGAGRISTDIRKVLQRYPTPLRFNPDIIAANYCDYGPLLVFIEAKSGRIFESSGYHGIETLSLEGLIQFEYLIRCIPVYVVTENWRVNRPNDIFKHCREGKITQSGSRKPYKLWPASMGRPWEWVF